MKKIVLGGVAVLIALSLVMIAACELDGIGGVTANPYTFDSNGNVVGVTAQINENGDFYIPAFKRPTTRAINKVVADRGIERFEVVFMQGPVATSKVARAQWELGDAVSVKNVPRAGTGGAPINYYAVDPAAATTDILGAAVLFAGMKNGTLLAVGRISAIDGTAVTTTAPISAGTKSVTFSLAALIGDASKFVVSDTATITPPAQPNHKSVPVSFGDVITPASFNYKGWILRPSISTFTAAYTLDTSSSSFTLANMSPAILCVGGGTVKQIIPQVIGIDKSYKIKGTPSNFTPAFATATTTALAANAAFPSTAPQINFTIATTAENGIIALYFEIPVYALNIKNSDDGFKPLTWYIRNGYDYNFLDIGPNGTGGSIFFAVDPNIDTTNTLDYSDGLPVIGVMAP